MPRSLALSLFLLSSLAAIAEEVHLDSCDGLPVVEVTVAGAKAAKSKMRFLVDTAATSMLNSKSFAHGDPTRVSVTSWSGTVETKSHEVALPELVIGEHRLTDLHLPAVDLSAIGQACGKKIDGILGVDLLSRLGATLDLKNHTIELVADSKTAEATVADLQQQLMGCEEAFNRADESAFAECLDPQIVTFTFWWGFLRTRRGDGLLQQEILSGPAARLSYHGSPRPYLIGDAVWVEYDLKIVLPQQIITARGTALCRKSAGRWRIVHMNHSSPPPDALQAQTKSETQP